MPYKISIRMKKQDRLFIARAIKDCNASIVYLFFFYILNISLITAPMTPNFIMQKIMSALS